MRSLLSGKSGPPRFPCFEAFSGSGEARTLAREAGASGGRSLTGPRPRASAGRATPSQDPAGPMPQRLPPLPRTLAIAAVLTAPAAAVLLVLAAAGALSGGLAVAGTLAVFLALVLPVHRHLRHLRRLAGRLSGREAPPRERLSGFHPELDRAVLEADTRSRGRLAELEATLAG